MATGRTGGGRATHGGANYQNRVSAWLAVKVLAEEAAALPWDLPDGTALDGVYNEAEEAVDDIIVLTSRGGRIFVQAKHTVNVSQKPDSELASVMDQFVRQYLAAKRSASGRQAPREMDATRDRLVLVTSHRSSSKITRNLPDVLGRIHSLRPGQHLNEAARNAPDTDALGAVVNHVIQAWRKEQGQDPSDQDIRAFLPLVRVQVLDVDEGGASEQTVVEQLKGAVLSDPAQADLAWGHLIKLFARYAAQGGGADRKELQRQLANTGIRLKTMRSFESDVSAAREYARQRLTAMERSTRIRFGGVRIHIERDVTPAVRRAAEDGGLLLVGEAGAGKTGALHTLCKQLMAEGRDVIVVSARTLSHGLGALRTDMGLAHRVTSLLENWVGDQPGFLLIDAIDAARDSTGALDALVELVEAALRTGSRWHVVATVREHDARSMGSLRRCFPGEPLHEMQAPEGMPGFRHLLVLPLSDDELRQVEAQAPSLTSTVETAPGRFRELLRNVFNLSLMAELVENGVQPSDLAALTTQRGLLDLYWRERVTRDDTGRGDREHTLRVVVERMLACLSLGVSRQDVMARGADRRALEDLLSARVLSATEPPNNSVSFGHDVLFDYAVTRILFDVPTNEVVRRLEQDRSLALLVRPSIELHLQCLWDQTGDHTPFWEMVLAIDRSEEVGEMAKTIAARAVVELTEDASNWNVLVARLDGPDADAVGKLLRRVTDTLLTDAAGGRDALVGQKAALWCEVWWVCSEHMGPDVAASLVAFFRHAKTGVRSVAEDQAKALNGAARNLLAYLTAYATEDPWPAIEAVETIGWTVAAAPKESADSLRRLLSPSVPAAFREEVLPWLGRQAEALVPHDPGLVRDLYRATYVEPPPPLETLSPMARALHGERWHRSHDLANSLKTFLTREPAMATETLVEVVRAYVEDEHHPVGDEQVREFNVDGRPARFRRDYSFLWDDTLYRTHEPMQMIGGFTEYLRSVSADPEAGTVRRAIVNVLVTHNELAVLWRRLLIVGAEFPETLGMEVRSLLWAPPILRSSDTRKPAGDAMTAIYPVLPAKDRENVERAVLAMPDLFIEERQDEGIWLRDMYLGCLSRDMLVSEEAREILAHVDGQGGPPPNEPEPGIVSWHGEYGERGWLSDEGVEVDAPANLHIQTLNQPVKSFLKQHKDAPPTSEASHAVLPHLRALHEALKGADTVGVHPKQRDYGWGVLADACNVIARTDAPEADAEFGAYLVQVLLEASQNGVPVYDPEGDEAFDEHPSWGGPAARVSAAAGLIAIARHPSCCTSDVLDAVERLSRDEVPAVRFQIAAYLNALYETANDRMWTIFRRMAREEPRAGVLLGLVGGPATILALGHTERVAEASADIYRRLEPGKRTREARDHCVHLLTGLYLGRGQETCRQIVQALADAPDADIDGADDMAREFHIYLVRDYAAPPPTEWASVRQRAYSLLRCLLQGITSVLSRGPDQLEASHQDDDGLGLHARLIRVADHVAHVLRRAADGMVPTHSEPGAPLRQLDLERRFLLDSMEGIVPLFLPILSADALEDLVGALSPLLAVGPERAFALAVRLLDGAGPRAALRGYRLGAVAAGLLRSVYINHRRVLTGHRERLEDFQRVLEALAAVGHREARALMDEIGDALR